MSAPAQAEALFNQFCNPQHPMCLESSKRNDLVIKKRSVVCAVLLRQVLDGKQIFFLTIGMIPVIDKHCQVVLVTAQACPQSLSRLSSLPFDARTAASGPELMVTFAPVWEIDSARLSSDKYTQQGSSPSTHSSHTRVRHAAQQRWRKRAEVRRSFYAQQRRAMCACIVIESLAV